MNTPLTDQTLTTTLHAVVETRAPAPAISVPLDDFLRVDVMARPSLRVTVRNFLQEHCARRSGITLIAGRGKLIADLMCISGQRITFGEVVKHVSAALAHSEFRMIRALDARELSAQLCLAALDLR